MRKRTVLTELTPREAAERLSLSLPELAQLLEDGVLPARNLGGRVRIREDDIVALQRDDRARREATRELTREAQELGLDY